VTSEQVRKTQELRRSNAAQPIPGKRDGDDDKHPKREMEERRDDVE
jgi:hypothetical protein